MTIDSCKVHSASLNISKMSEKVSIYSVNPNQTLIQTLRVNNVWCNDRIDEEVMENYYGNGRQDDTDEKVNNGNCIKKLIFKNAFQTDYLSLKYSPRFGFGQKTSPAKDKHSCFLNRSLDNAVDTVSKQITERDILSKQNL